MPAPVLQHVALSVRDIDKSAESDSGLARLNEFGVENSGVVESQFGWHLNFRDPDGIPFESFLSATG